MNLAAPYTPYSLKKHNTFAIDSMATQIYHFESLQQITDLPALYPWASRPFLILGGGSNVLFVHDYPGLVLFQQYRSIEVLDTQAQHIWVRVGGGTLWHDWVTYCVEQQWYGLENLALIPGTVGAAPIQNIGAYGVECAQYIESVEAVHLVTGEHRLFQHKECDFGYRYSCFKQPEYTYWMIIQVTFKLSLVPEYCLNYAGLSDLDPPRTSIQQVYDTVIRLRQHKLPDPETTPNAGSFFKNPVVSAEHFSRLKTKFTQMPHYPAEHGVKLSAAWMIEYCGLKGMRHQGAAISSQHALVIINPDNASGQAVYELAQQVKKTVQENFDITLEPEVQIISQPSV